MQETDEYRPTSSALPLPARIGAPVALTLTLLTGCVSGGTGEQPGDDAGDVDGSGQQGRQDSGTGKGDPIFSTTATWLPGAAQLDIMGLERVSPETVILRFQVTNNSNESIVMLHNMSSEGGHKTSKTPSGVSLIDPKAQKQYFPWHTVNETCYCSEWENQNFPAGATWEFWAGFPAPPEDVKALSVAPRIAAPIHDIQITDGSAPKKPSGDFAEPRVLDIRDLQEDLESGTSRDESPEEVAVMLSSDVLFDLNESKLTSKADQILKQVAKEISDSSAKTVKIDGYTDSSGNDSINQPLSEDRAASVEKKLKKLITRSGVSFEVAGHGSDNPVADNSTEEGAKKNRRVTVTFAK